MGKASKWLKNLLTGKKEKDKEKNGNKPATLVTGSPLSVPVPKEKRRWSFRRPTAPGKDSNYRELVASASSHGFSDTEVDKKRPSTVAVSKNRSAGGRANAIEEAAAIKIQAVFRSYQARKALCALKGLVKLQALVRGHLVRKRAAATLQCMQALITAQARVQAQRIRMLEESQSTPQWQHNGRRSPQHPSHRQSYEMDTSAEESVKIVEMDLGETYSSSRSRHSRYSASTGHKNTTAHVHARRTTPNIDAWPQVSPAPSALNDMSPRTYSGRFEELSFTTEQSSPRCHDTPKSSFSTSRHEEMLHSSVSHDYSFPSYMANTESSRAKARSQSAPKQRPDAWERQASRRRASVEGRNIPRSIKMQRSASHVGSVAASAYDHCPWLIKLDKSNMSVRESDSGSTSTGITSNNYY